VEDNSVLLFSELMDSASLFLTGNCDTVYFLSFVDLSGGPDGDRRAAARPAVGDLGHDR
jgi:Uncharacterized conserved protein